MSITAGLTLAWFRNAESVSMILHTLRNAEPVNIVLHTLSVINPLNVFVESFPHEGYVYKLLTLVNAEVWLQLSVHRQEDNIHCGV